MKVVSLVPSQSELLWHLGLRQELAGITKFCIHPNEMFRTVPRVGGTKTVNIDAICALQPDLIIANREENEKTQVEELQKTFNVHVTDIYTLNDALHMIETVGTLVKRTQAARALSAQIAQRFSALQPVGTAKKAVYLIWKNPYMAAGTQTFIDDMLQKAGFENAIKDPRYPVTDMESIKALAPDVVLLSSEPYPFSQKHIAAFSAAGLKAVVADGEMFSWYGSRLLEAPAYFNALRQTFP